MLDKIKAFAESVKNVVIYILGPILAIAGYIYYLVSKNHTLQDEVNQKDGESKLNELKTQQASVDTAAAASGTNYEQLLGQYQTDLRPGADGVQQGVPRSEGAGSDTGSADSTSKPSS